MLTEPTPNRDTDIPSTSEALDEIPPAAPEYGERGVSLLDSVYAGLKEAEALPANRDHVILVRGLPRGRLGLREGQPEYAALEAHGVSTADIKSGRMTRGTLLDAGYVFQNRLGDGEKPLISGQIADPDDPNNALDFTDRVLLTGEELQKVYVYQQAHPDLFGLDGENLDDVRKDMLSFLYDATYEPPFGSRQNFLNNALPRTGDHWDLRIWGIDRANPGAAEEEQLVQFEQDVETVARYWDAQVAAYRETDPDTQLGDLEISLHLQDILSRGCEDIYTWPGDTPMQGIQKKREHTIKALSVRNSKLDGRPSPFLESGFVFDHNPDVEVFLEKTAGESGERRLNMGNVHLFGGHPDFPGLSEMGGGDDQIYMTLQTYLAELYPRNLGDRELVQNSEMSSSQSTPMGEVVRRFQERLISAARTWDTGMAQTPRQEDLGTDWKEQERQALEEYRQSEEAKRNDPDYWL